MATTSTAAGSLTQRSTAAGSMAERSTAAGSMAARSAAAGSTAARSAAAGRRLPWCPDPRWPSPRCSRSCSHHVSVILVANRIEGEKKNASETDPMIETKD